LTKVELRKLCIDKFESLELVDDNPKETENQDEVAEEDGKDVVSQEEEVKGDFNHVPSLVE
jgi:hypothetical protein